MKRLIPLALLAAVAWLLLDVVPRQLIYPARLPVTQSPTELGLQYSDVVLTPSDSNINLAAWWMPAQQPRAALVFLHGGSSNRHTSYFGALAFYQAMVQQNVSVLAPDLRNHGASDSTPGGIQFGQTEYHDALAAVAWVRQHQPGVPVYLMGISMGGATAIYAAANGAAIDGLILLDPLLDTRTAFTRAITAETGLPAALFAPSAWAAIQFFGLPDGQHQALHVASQLTQPMLLLQDPADPVTLASHATSLVAANPAIKLWLAPAAPADHPELAWRKNWGTHVAAFLLHRQATMQQLLAFMQLSPTRDP